jgi:ribosomal protein S18 acetylase RimI-like enzyme
MSAERLQSFLRASVRARSTAEISGPFECFFQADDPLPNFNYAIPLAPVSFEEARIALPELERVFARRERLPRFEFVGSYAPQLQAALEAAGYLGESATYAMSCSAAELAELDLGDGATLSFVTDETSDADLAATIAVRCAGFGAPDRSGEPAVVEQARIGARSSPVAFVRSAGRVAGAATRSSIHEGIAEIAGVAVFEAARGRGFGGALTAFLARDGFAHGATLIFLTAGDKAAARVYARAGFRPSGDGVLEYRKGLNRKRARPRRALSPPPQRNV